MKELDTGKAPMNFKEYQQALAAGEVEPIQPPKHV
jgi:hypothetical protein